MHDTSSQNQHLGHNVQCRSTSNKQYNIQAFLCKNNQHPASSSKSAGLGCGIFTKMKLTGVHDSRRWHQFGMDDIVTMAAHTL